jgi:hypothetical protein
MRKQQDLVAVIVIGLIGFSLPCLAGGTTTDAERSVDELKLMTTPELAGEARLVCRLVGIYLESAQKSRELGRKFRDVSSYDQTIQQSTQAYLRKQYLQRVGLVLRDRHHGEMLTWFEQRSRAVDQSISREGTDQPSPPDCDTLAAAGGWRPKP